MEPCFFFLYGPFEQSWDVQNPEILRVKTSSPSFRPKLTKAWNVFDQHQQRSMNYISYKLTAAKRSSRHVILVWFLTNNPLIFRRGCQLQCRGGDHSSDHNSNNIHGWVSEDKSENNWEMLEFHFSSFYLEHFQAKHAGTISYSYCFLVFLRSCSLFRSCSFFHIRCIIFNFIF